LGKDRVYLCFIFNNTDSIKAVPTVRLMSKPLLLIPFRVDPSPLGGEGARFEEKHEHIPN